MPRPMFELLTGTVDGSNAVFAFPRAYIAGSTAIYLNGQLIMKAVLPWSETSPTLGTITITDLDSIPQVGDVVAGFALDTLPETVVEEISASLSTTDYLSATIESLD